MFHNLFFTDYEKRTFYGERYGYSIEYVLKEQNGKKEIFFKPNMIYEDPFWRYQSKRTLIGECIKELAEQYEEVYAKIYQVNILFKKNETLGEIWNHIDMTQRSFIAISCPQDIKIQIEANINIALREIDIYSL